MQAKKVRAWTEGDGTRLHSETQSLWLNMVVMYYEVKLQR